MVAMEVLGSMGWGQMPSLQPQKVTGSLCRTTASTMMNTHSSRSHAIFTVYLEQTISGEGSKDASNDEAASGTEYRMSKFHFVDLAGSERAKRRVRRGERKIEMARFIDEPTFGPELRFHGFGCRSKITIYIDFEDFAE